MHQEFVIDPLASTTAEICTVCFFDELVSTAVLMNDSSTHVELSRWIGAY